jgi:hypothetical protein
MIGDFQHRAGSGRHSARIRLDRPAQIRRYVLGHSDAQRTRIAGDYGTTIGGRRHGTVEHLLDYKSPRGPCPPYRIWPPLARDSADRQDESPGPPSRGRARSSRPRRRAARGSARRSAAPSAPRPGPIRRLMVSLEARARTIGAPRPRRRRHARRASRAPPRQRLRRGAEQRFGRSGRRLLSSHQPVSIQVGAAWIPRESARSADPMSDSQSEELRHLATLMDRFPSRRSRVRDSCPAR